MMLTWCLLSPSDRWLFSYLNINYNVKIKVELGVAAVHKNLSIAEQSSNILVTVTVTQYIIFVLIAKNNILHSFPEAKAQTYRRWPL